MVGSEFGSVFVCEFCVVNFKWGILMFGNSDRGALSLRGRWGLRGEVFFGCVVSSFSFLLGFFFFLLWLF